jgi:hypothetical protein
MNMDTMKCHKRNKGLKKTMALLKKLYHPAEKTNKSKQTKSTAINLESFRDSSAKR